MRSRGGGAVVAVRDPADDLSEFPARHVRAGTLLHRVHRAGWAHFSTDGSGRFDVERLGTLYLAEAPLGALLEVARGLTLLSPEWRAVRRLTSTRLTSSVRLADTTHPRAYSYGVTNELASTADYAVPQRWAVAFAARGFDGVRYVTRHDVACGETSIALFGSPRVRAAIDVAGAKDPAGPRRPDRGGASVRHPRGRAPAPRPAPRRAGLGLGVAGATDVRCSPVAGVRADRAERAAAGPPTA